MSTSRPSDPTLDYYAARADEFVRETLAVDMTPLYEPFLALVRPGGRVLDAGCGSGRDARAFLRRGYAVTAFDASPELARLASGVVGQPVGVLRFQDVAYEEAFDGVWACASLLHLPRAGVRDAVGRLVKALVPGGVLYVSFKRGAGEGERGGRHFTDYTADGLRTELNGCAGLAVVGVWESADVRPGREAEGWVNALARKRLGAGG
jgi:SAM-dependent methyltransferase